MFCTKDLTIKCDYLKDLFGVAMFWKSMWFVEQSTWSIENVFINTFQSISITTLFNNRE